MTANFFLNPDNKEENLILADFLCCCIPLEKCENKFALEERSVLFNDKEQERVYFMYAEEDEQEEDQEFFVYEN